MNPAVLSRELAAAVAAPVLDGDAVAPYLLDATEARGLRGRADAVVLARTADDVAGVLAWCYEHDVPLTARGGGSGYAGGAVPDGGVVVALAGLRSIRSIEPLQWRAEIESGVTTHEVQRLARENGLYYPPDPGAAEQSQLGGNVATNAGGPHAFKYGVTGAWVTSLEVAIAPGELVTFGSGVRKDVAGYDVRALLIGSEGTLGIVTAVRLKLIPPPAARRPVVAFYSRDADGAAAVMHAMASGTLPRRSSSSTARRSRSPAAASRSRSSARDSPRSSSSRRQTAARRRPRPARCSCAKRFGGSGGGADAVTAGGGRRAVALARRDRHRRRCVPRRQGQRGRLRARRATGRGDRRHARGGDRRAARGVLLGSRRRRQRALVVPLRRRRRRGELRAAAAAERVFDAAVSLGGTVTGEHGIGLVKSAQLSRQLSPGGVDVHRAVKRLFDPKNLLNRGKKVA